jgi:hypothetical protein
VTDAELVEFTSEFRAGILGGRGSARMCAAVCMPLVTLLGLHGVEAVLMESETETCNHVWLRLTDGRVLDPTGDQFAGGMPPVYLGPPLALHADPMPFQG